MDRSFRVSWSTGYIEVDVIGYFCELPLRIIDEFLRFAKTHCTSEQQCHLLSLLEETKRYVAWWHIERIEKVIKRIKSQSWDRKEKRDVKNHR